MEYSPIIQPFDEQSLERAITKLDWFIEHELKDKAIKQADLICAYEDIYDNLLTLFGDKEQAASWLDNQNDHLSGIPRQLIQSENGIQAVLDYLNYFRYVK